MTSGNVLIENLTIINKEADRVNAWGIFVNQAPGVRIMNNKITVSDPKAAYAIYILESSDIDVFNNILTSEGDYLTFTKLKFTNQNIQNVKQSFGFYIYKAKFYKRKNMSWQVVAQVTSMLLTSMFGSELQFANM